MDLPVMPPVRPMLAKSVKGIPDRIAVKDGRFYGIEVKAPTGRMSPYQTEFKTRLEEAGGVYIEARSLEDVMKHL